MKVHVLHHGRSYCDKEGVPGDWPEDHKWVPVAKFTGANCEECLVVLLADAVTCDSCSAVLVDGHGRLVAEARTTALGCNCHPCCSKADTELSQGFSAGNYCNAYEAQDLADGLAKRDITAASAAYHAAFIMGFFGSYELHEISSTYREQFDEGYRVACRHVGSDWVSRLVHRLLAERTVLAYRVFAWLGW